MPPGFPTLPGPAAAASAKPLRKLRVLCLHGKRQNAGIFADRLSPLSKHADLVFLEADFDCGAPGSEGGSGSTEQEQDHYCAKNANDVKESASDGTLSWTPPRSPGTCSAGGAAAESVCDWLPALLKVRRCWVASGPFDGVLGFSQGGALASLVCVLKDVFCPLLRFGVVCSGYWPGGDFEAEEATVPAALPDDSDKLQIFHFIGEKDGIVPTAVSRKGVPLPSSSQSFFLHGGGHAVPLAMLQREIFADEQSGLGKRARDEAVDAAAEGLLEGFQHSLLQKILENVQEGPQALLQENADLLRAWRENVEAERELLDATFALEVDAPEDTNKNVNKIMDLVPKKKIMDNNFWCVENLACGREFSLDLWYPPGFGSAPRVRPFLFRRTIETANFFLHARYPDLVTHLNREVLQLLLEDDYDQDDGRAGGGATSRLLVSPSVEEPLEVVSLSLPSHFSTRLHEDEGPQAAPLDIGFGVTLGLAAADWERSVQPEPEDDNDNHLAKKPACENKSGAASPLAGAASPHVKWWEREYEDDERLDLDVGLMREAYREFVDTCLTSSAKNTSDVFRAIPGERGNQRRGRPFEFVLGLVGKPSAGKSTFFNALTAYHEQQPGGHQEGDESRRTKAEVAAHPFTTIEPNIGEAWLRVENSNSGEKIPFLVKDVAGLVPGAWAGRGRGNAFLNDLLRADVLAHVVDVTGRLDAQGEVDVVAASVTSSTSNTDGATATARSAENVLHDIQFIREEVAAWIFTNVRAKFGSVWKLAAFNHDKSACSSAVDRFVVLFTGYHCTPDFVRNLWLAWATTSSAQGMSSTPSTSPAPRSRLNFATYSEADLMSFVHCFVHCRFPMLLVCNKVDLLLVAPENKGEELLHQEDGIGVGELRRRLELIRKSFPEYDARRLVPVSAKHSQNIPAAVKAAFLAAGATVMRVVARRDCGWEEVEQHDQLAGPGAFSAFFDDVGGAGVFASPSSREQHEGGDASGTPGTDGIIFAGRTVFSYHLLPPHSTVHEAFQAVGRSSCGGGTTPSTRGPPGAELQLPCSNSDFVRAERGPKGTVAKKDEILKDALSTLKFQWRRRTHA